MSCGGLSLNLSSAKIRAVTFDYRVTYRAQFDWDGYYVTHAILARPLATTQPTSYLTDPTAVYAILSSHYDQDNNINTFQPGFVINEVGDYVNLVVPTIDPAWGPLVDAGFLLVGEIEESHV